MLDERSWVRSSGFSARSGVIVAQLDAAIEYARKLGVRIPSASRIARSRAYLDGLADRAAQGEPPTAADAPLLQDHQRTAVEFALIAVAAYEDRRNSQSPFTKDKLQQVVFGPDSPAPPPINDGARDTQFELMVAAELRLGGASVYSGEPDIRLLFGTEIVGIAAKRIRSRSASQLARNIDNAVTQILRQPKLRGFIAINLDARFGETAGDQGREELLESADAVFESASAQIERHADKQRLLGLFQYGNIVGEPRPVAGEQLPVVRTTQPLRLEFFADDPVEQDRFRAFTERWRASFGARVKHFFSGEHY